MTAITVAAIVSLAAVTMCLALVICALSLVGRLPDRDSRGPDDADL